MSLSVCVYYRFNSLYNGLFDAEMIPPSQQLKCRIFSENFLLMSSTRYLWCTHKQSAIYCGKHACTLSIQDRKSQLLKSTALPLPLAHCESIRVTQRSSSESKAAFKQYLRIQLSSRGKKQLTVSVWLWTACMRFIAVACMYNLVHILRIHAEGFALVVFIMDAVLH